MQKSQQGKKRKVPVTRQQTIEPNSANPQEMYPTGYKVKKHKRDNKEKNQ